MKLRRVRAGTWQVLALSTDRGDCPLLDFLAALEGGLVRDGWRMLKLLDGVAEQGPPRNTEISHMLAPGIWEFIQGRLRVLWFYDEGRLVICSHGFVKRSRKTPLKELARAQSHRHRYLNAKRRAELEVEG